MPRLLLVLAVLAALVLPGAGSAQEGASAPQSQPAPAWYESGGSLDSASGTALEAASALPFYNLLTPFGADAPLTDEAGKVVIGPTGQPVQPNLPLVVVWLVIGAVFFTLTWRFANFLHFNHAIHVLRWR